MGAVVVTPGPGRARFKFNLISGTLHVIQPDRAIRRLLEFTAGQHDSSPVAQLATHDLGIKVIPEVITYCTPRVIVEHLHPALAFENTACQTNWNEGPLVPNHIDAQHKTVATSLLTHFGYHSVAQNHRCKVYMIGESGASWAAGHVSHLGPVSI